MAALFQPLVSECPVGIDGNCKFCGRHVETTGGCPCRWSRTYVTGQVFVAPSAFTPAKFYPPPGGWPYPWS